MTSMPMTQTPVPSVEELGLDQYIIDGKSFDALLAERQNLNQLIADAEDRLIDINAEVGAALDLKGVKNALWKERYLITRREAARPRALLDRTLLLNAGVTPIQLEAGTKYGKPGKSGVTVTDITKKKGKSSDSTEPGDFSSFEV